MVCPGLCLNLEKYHCSFAGLSSSSSLYPLRWKTCNLIESKCTTLWHFSHAHSDKAQMWRNTCDLSKTICVKRRAFISWTRFTRLCKRKKKKAVDFSCGSRCNDDTNAKVGHRCGQSEWGMMTEKCRTLCRRRGSLLQGQACAEAVIHWYWLTAVLFCDLSAWQSRRANAGYVNSFQQCAALELV